jgi:hypothetical protein
MAGLATVLASTASMAHNQHNPEWATSNLHQAIHRDHHELGQHHDSVVHLSRLNLSSHHQHLELSTSLETQNNNRIQNHLAFLEEHERNAFTETGRHA